VAKQRVREPAAPKIEELPQPQEDLNSVQAEAVRGGATSVKTFGIGKLPPVVSQADYMPPESLTADTQITR
jgi:hypothetical protein